MMASHQPIGLRLYRADGTRIGSTNISSDPDDVAAVREFMGGGANARTWVEDEGERKWVRGVMRLTSNITCQPCHASDQTLGYATMKLDFTEQLGEIRQVLRDRVLALLGSWLALVGVVAVVVQRTVRRSARRLEAELSAAAAGKSEGGATSALPLDPVAAELHRSLRQFLERQRQRDAEVADRLAHVDQLASLGQLAAGLAHEIKNPLAGIHGALELLRDESLDERTRGLFDEMLGELRRVHDILQRLLESGRPAPLRLVRTDLARLLTDVGELLRPSLRRQQVELVTEATEGLPKLELDAAKIRQVLVNLIQNAAEAMPASGGRVVVRAGAFPAEQAVVVAVEDNGPGISPEQIAKLFEPFYTTKFSGTGLGLSISKSLIEQHGGRIEVHSEPGRGTTFLILFPLSAGSQAAAHPETN